MSRLLDQVRERVRRLHYSIRTEEAYVDWARKVILFHGKRHPLEMGEAEIRQFLTHLAVDRQVAASTHNQAQSVLLFLYREVLNRPLETLGEIAPAKRPDRLPVVLSRDEVRAVLAQLQGPSGSWPPGFTASGSGSLSACGCGSRILTRQQGKTGTRGSGQASQGQAQFPVFNQNQGLRSPTENRVQGLIPRVLSVWPRGAEARTPTLGPRGLDGGLVRRGANLPERGTEHFQDVTDRVALLFLP